MAALLPIVLAGGSGTRLWPLAGPGRPKPLQALVGDRTLLADTLLRIEALPGEVLPAWIVCGEEHRYAVAETARLAGATIGAIVLEPASRGTAAAIAAAAYLAEQERFDGQLLVMPSDHVIDRDEFLAGVEIARASNTAGHLVTFGVTPRSPATGYGYVEQDTPAPYSRVVRFVEKPDRATAETYVAEPRFLWNSGMFLFAPRAMLGVWEARDRASSRAVADAVRAGQRSDVFFRLGERFHDAETNSIDYAVMEHADDVYVARLGSSWSDVGTWDAVADAIGRDGNGNVVRGGAVAIDSRDSIVVADGARVGVLGVEGLIVAVTDDGVLVAAREREQDVRRIAERLPVDADGPRQVRPWGAYRVVARGPGFLVKEITVSANSALSLQQHAHRSEHWVVLEGSATVVQGERSYRLGVNEATTIASGERHRLANDTNEPLVVIEVQLGDVLDEADIVRFEDDYGRVST